MNFQFKKGDKTTLDCVIIKTSSNQVIEIFEYEDGTIHLYLDDKKSKLISSQVSNSIVSLEIKN